MLRCRIGFPGTQKCETFNDSSCQNFMNLCIHCILCRVELTVLFMLYCGLRNCALLHFIFVQESVE